MGDFLDAPQTVTITPDTPSPLAQWKEAREKGPARLSVINNTVEINPTDDAQPHKADGVTEEAPESPDPTPAEPAKTGERWSDPDTGEVLDMRTRRAKRIKSLWQKTQDLEAKLAAQTPSPSAPASPTTPPAAAARPQADDPEPKEVDFADDWNAWQRAHTGWIARQEFQKQRTRDKTDADALSFREGLAQQATAYATRAKAFASEVPDFAERISKADLPISHVMQHAVFASEQGPRIALWLLDHPTDAAALKASTDSLGPDQMPLVRDLLESKLPAKAAAAVPPVTRAPSPVTPLTGAASVASPVLADVAKTGSLSAWKRARGYGGAA